MSPPRLETKQQSLPNRLCTAMDYYIFNWILESRMHHLVKRNGNPVLQDDFVCSMIPPNLSSFNAKYDKTTNKPGHFRQLPFVRPPIRPTFRAHPHSTWPQCGWIAILQEGTGLCTCAILYYKATGSFLLLVAMAST